MTGPFIVTFAPEFVLAINGAAVLCIALGLYELVFDDVRPERDLAVLLDVDAAHVDLDPSDD